MLSKISTTEVIGISSVAFSIAAVFASIGSIGVPLGVPRFLGKSFAEGAFGDVKVFVKSSLLITSVGVVISGYIIYAIRELIVANFSLDVLLVSILLTACTAIATLLRSIVIASLEVKTLPLAMTISSVLMIMMAIFFILSDIGALGVIVAYISYHIIFSSILLFSLAPVLRAKSVASLKLGRAVKSILTASFPSWIPSLITTVGSAELGTIIVFGSMGANEAGSYFLSYAIFSVIAAISYSLFAIGYPLLSSMSEGRKKAMWMLLKNSLVISLPVSSSIIFYSGDVMGLLGQDSLQAGATLGIFLISILPNSVLLGITTLVYAYGNYKQVLVLGLSSSLPRAIFYFVFVDLMGSLGGATSFTLGSVVGFVFSIVVAKKIGMLLNWKNMAFLLLIPLVTSYLFSYFQFSFTIGILVPLVLSYAIFFKFRIIDLNDIENMLELLPFPLAQFVIITISKITSKLNRK
jgi:O-antigen/teichoic acid export membrane protein